MRKWRTAIISLATVVASAAPLAAAQADVQPNPQWVATWNAGWASYQALEAIPLADRGYVTQTVSLPITINAKIDDVFEIYSNVNNALGLHPFLTGIQPVRETEQGDVETIDFVALESIPLPDGTIFPGETVTRQVINEDKKFYDVDTYDFPGIVTHQHITFTKVGKKQTLVTETLTFEAPPAFIGLTAGGGVFAHQLVQQGLKAGIENGTLHD